MIILDYDIRLKSLEDILTISCFGDLHIGDRGCDEARLQQDLERCNQNPNDYSLFNGDQLDAIIPKDIGRFRPDSVPEWMTRASSGLAPGAFIDRQINRAASILRIRDKDKVIGYGDGNHEDSILKWHGTDISPKIVEKLWGLGIILDDREREDEASKHLLGYSAFIKLHVSFDSGNTRQLITVYTHHGWGGGSRTEGYNLTKYAKQIPYFDADIYVFSHCHDHQSKVIPYLSATNSKGGRRSQLKGKDRLLIVTGTYKRALIENQRTPSFEEQKGFPPRKLGYVSAKIKWYDNGNVRMGYEVF